MTTRRKSFKSGTKISDFEPVEFELNDQTFTCTPAVQGAVLLEFVAAADSESGGAAAGAIYSFFKDVMTEAEYARFRDYLNNPDLIFDMEAIGEIAGWLVEEYTSRPTKAPVSSSVGELSSGPMSTVAVS